jgi:hypothetical protein
MLKTRLHGIALALILTGCGPVDEAMRRVDVLDRVFEPSRFRTPPADAPTDAPTNAPLAGPLGGPPKDPVVVAAPAPEPEASPVLQPSAEDALVGESAAAPAAEPVQVDPAARAAFLVRQNPWISRFWSELGPAEQARVNRAFARRGATEAPAAAWDPMGLQERVELLFGRGRGAS